MAFSIQNEPPSEIIAGDAYSFYLTDSDHPATSWTATAYFKDSDGVVKSYARSSTLTVKHLFVLTNANTATLTTGDNLLGFAFSDGTHRQVSDWKQVKVIPDPTATEAPSFAQAQVTLLETVIAKFNTSAHSQVSFNGQSFTRASVGEYQKQLTYWQARVLFEQDQRKADLGLTTRGNRIPLEFVS